MDTLSYEPLYNIYRQCDGISKVFLGLTCTTFNRIMEENPVPFIEYDGVYTVTSYIGSLVSGIILIERFPRKFFTLETFTRLLRHFIKVEGEYILHEDSDHPVDFIGSRISFRGKRPRSIEINRKPIMDLTRCHFRINSKNIVRKLSNLSYPVVYFKLIVGSGFNISWDACMLRNIRTVYHIMKNIEEINSNV